MGYSGDQSRTVHRNGIKSANFPGKIDNFFPWQPGTGKN